MKRRKKEGGKRKTGGKAECRGGQGIESSQEMASPQPSHIAEGDRRSQGMGATTRGTPPQASVVNAASLTLGNAAWVAAVDGFLVIDANGNVLGYNDRFLQLWQASDIQNWELHSTPSLHPPLLELVFSRLKWSQEFIANLESLSQDGLQESYDELYLHDGRVFECASRPLSANVSPGEESATAGNSPQHQRILFFRDITERKKAEIALRDQSRLSTLAAEVGVALGQSSSLSRALDRCTESLVQHLDAAFAGIWLLNENTRLLELHSHSGEQPTEAEFGNRIPLGISIIGFIAQSRSPYVTKETVQNSKFNHAQSSGPESVISQPSEEVVAFAGYPLIVEERLMGVVALCSRGRVTEGTRNTLRWVANAIAVAIDRVKARTELLSRREALLFRLASQIRNSLNLDRILEVAVQEIQQLLQVDWCVFMWYRGEVLGEKSSHKNPATASVRAKSQVNWEVVKEAKNSHLPSLIGYYSPAIVSGVNSQLGELVKIFNEKLLNLEILRWDSLDSKGETVLKDWLLSWGCSSFLTLPIQTQKGAVGAIGCIIHAFDASQQDASKQQRFRMNDLSRTSSSPHRTWSDSEVELLKAVTEQLAIAIEQAELYTQSLESAAEARVRANELGEALHKLQSTQAQLIQTEKISSLGQMVAGVAHEINNPMNFIAGNLGCISEYVENLLGLLNLYEIYYPHPADEIQREADAIDFKFIREDLPKLVNSMKLGTERVTEIVQSLRNFSRVDETHQKKVDIQEGIENTLLILRHRLKGVGEKSNIQIVKNYGNLPLVAGYGGQLNQVFMNIISNAIDALENQPEPRMITITTAATAATTEQRRIAPSDTEFVIIQIRDNGPGIPADLQPRLFDPFFTTKPVGKGTGLGLSISYQIVVEKHGGMLKCNSSPGEGTEFLIQIPVHHNEFKKC